MSTSRKIFTNTALQIVGKIGVGFFGIFVSMLLARYLTLEERGLYEYVYTFLGFAGIIADLGLYTIAIKELAEDEEKTAETLAHILGLRLLLGLLMILLVLVLAFLFPTLGRGWDALFFWALFFGGISTVLALLTGALTSILQVRYDMLHGTLGQIVGKIAIILTMIGSIFFLFPKPFPGYSFPTAFWGLQSLFIAGVVGNICMYVYTWFFVKKYTKVSFRISKTTSILLLKQALPYALSLVLGTLYFKIDAFLLAFLLPADVMKSQLALYSASVKVLEIFTILPLFFLNSLLPLLTKRLQEGGKELAELLQNAFDVLAMMAVPILAGGVALAPEIIVFTNSSAYRSHEGFIGSDYYLRILIFALLFSFLNLLFNFVLIARNRQKILLYVNFFVLLGNVLANILLIPIYGVAAAAYITVITEIVVLVALYLAARRSVEFSLHGYTLGKITVLGMLMGMSIWGIKSICGTIAPFFVIVLSGGVGVVFYLTGLVLLGMIPKHVVQKFVRR